MTKLNMSSDQIRSLILHLQKELESRESNELLQDLIADGKRVGLPLTGPGQHVQVAGAGRAKEGRSLEDWRPPGQAIMDRMLDQQDAKDRAERAKGG